MPNESHEEDTKSQSKVVSLIQKYDLKGVGAHMEQSWTGNDTEKRSLRELADYFNIRLLETEMAGHDMKYLDGEVENIYRLLTDDEITSGTRVQTRNRLENNGINVDRLLDDFVSRQAIHTYLTKVQGVTYSNETESLEDQIGRRTETIQRLKTRLAAVSEGSLKDFSNADEFSIGDANVIVSVHVHCTKCGTQAEMSELLADKGCDCSMS